MTPQKKARCLRCLGGHMLYGHGIASANGPLIEPQDIYHGPSCSVPIFMMSLAEETRDFEYFSDYFWVFWVNYNDLTTSEPWKSWFILGESSPNGRKIQVSELL